METEIPKPHGFVVSAEIAGDGYPMFKILRLRGPRDEALGQARRDMRQGNAPRHVLFIREDGWHETWGWDFLERTALTP